MVVMTVEHKPCKTCFVLLARTNSFFNLQISVKSYDCDFKIKLAFEPSVDLV